MVLEGECRPRAVGQNFEGLKKREIVRQAWMKLLLQAVEKQPRQNVFSLDV
jgi:hypothetical protein